MDAAPTGATPTAAADRAGGLGLMGAAAPAGATQPQARTGREVRA